MQDLRINTGEVELQVGEYEQDGDAVIFLHFGGGNLMMWQGKGRRRPGMGTPLRLDADPGQRQRSRPRIFH